MVTKNVNFARKMIVQDNCGLWDRLLLGKQLLRSICKPSMVIISMIVSKSIASGYWNSQGDTRKSKLQLPII